MLSNETLAVIRQRRSVRSYQDEQITNDELQAILEAGLYAPNAGGQAWHFTVVQNKGLQERLNAAAKGVAISIPAPALQALGANPNFDCLYNAPTLIIVSGDSHAFTPMDADCAAATQNMLLAAESLGLGSCYVFFILLAFATPQGGGLLQELQIPEGYKPLAAALVGHKRGETAPAEERKPDLITIIR